MLPPAGGESQQITYSRTLYVCNGCRYGAGGLGTGELASDSDVGAAVLCRRALGVNSPGEDAGVLWLLLSGKDAEEGMCV